MVTSSKSSPRSCGPGVVSVGCLRGSMILFAMLGTGIFEAHRWFRSGAVSAVAINNLSLLVNVLSDLTATTGLSPKLRR